MIWFCEVSRIDGMPQQELLTYGELWLSTTSGGTSDDEHEPRRAIDPRPLYESAVRIGWMNQLRARGEVFVSLEWLLERA